MLTWAQVEKGITNEGKVEATIGALDTIVVGHRTTLAARAEERWKTTMPFRTLILRACTRTLSPDGVRQDHGVVASTVAVPAENVQSA